MKIQSHRKFYPIENLMLKNGVCPICLHQQKFEIWDNEGHGGITQCDHCELYFRPVESYSDEKGFAFNERHMCGECGFICDMKYVCEKKDGGHIVAYKYICPICDSICYIGINLPSKRGYKPISKEKYEKRVKKFDNNKSWRKGSLYIEKYNTNMGL